MLPMRLLIFAPCFLDFFLHITALKHSCEVFQQYGDYAEYGGKCFLHEHKQLSWYEAKGRCEAMGGQLPRLEQSDQYNFVMTLNNYYRKGEKIKQEDTGIFVWIDGQKIDGKLYWTNDKQLLPLKADLPPTTSVMVRFTTELTSSTTTLMTSTEDMTSYLESKTTGSPPRAMAHSQDKLTWNEMNFRNVRHINGVLNPKLKLKPHSRINKTTLIQCAVECLSDGVCELLNFLQSEGHCHLYHDITAALEEGAESVIGWRLYKHGSLIIN